MAHTTKSATNAIPPKGWFMAGENPELYEASTDTSNPHSGTKCAYLRLKDKVKDTCSWGTLMQQMGAQDYLGKRVRMSFWVKTKDIDFHVQPWMRVDARSRDSISFDNMCNRSIKGDTDWTQYSIVLDVPGESTNIAFGIMLIGKGNVWLDDVSFEAVADTVPITDCPCSCNSTEPLGARNLNFEEGEEDDDCC